MTAEVVIVTPELSGAGGVGDYTRRLIEAWPENAKPRIIVPRNISEQLPANAGRVLLQYSAYGFDGRGFPQKLIRALIDWKSKTRGLLVLMFHEIWTFWPMVHPNAFTQCLHRRALKKLIRSADAIFTSTASQAAHLGKLCPEKSVRVLPVGSNIRRNENADFPRHRDWAVLFGLEGTRVRALKRMGRQLDALATSGAIAKIVTVGAGDGSLAMEERNLLSNFQLKEGFEQQGRQAENEISKLLLSTAFGISDQDELSLTKSGTFMAYGAHGVNVISEAADPAKAEPMCLLVSPDELSRQIPEPELKRRAQQLCLWQQRVSSWPSIATAFSDALQVNR